jgi:multicomponent Na+:H+ antiporter subunit B
MTDATPRGLGPRIRLALFAAAVLIALPGFVHVATRMPTFGAHALPYGDAINHAAPAERHVTNMTSAVNFDYRGFDTLGEEFMLLCAVTGVTVLLRGQRGETMSARPGRVRRRPVAPRADAVTLAGRLGAPLLLLFGLYIALHAMTTPGGGFQGGVIIATAGLLIFLADGYAQWRGMVSSEVADACEGLGATLYAVCGFAGLLLGLPFGANMLPLGSLGDLFSGGLMVIENVGVTLAVGGGFLVVFTEFLEETRAVAADRET